MNTVLDHLDSIAAKLTPEQRDVVLADLESLDERHAIQQESRDAEAKASNAAPVFKLGISAGDYVDVWISEMYPDPRKMGRDLRQGSASDVAIFTTHLFQPDQKLDDAIRRYATFRPFRSSEEGANGFANVAPTIDVSRLTFRRVHA